MMRKAIYLFMTGILSVITLPLVNGLQDGTSCYKGPHVVISSGRAKGQCHDCSSRYKCPKGSGLSIECAGQNVSPDISIYCVACVAGVNFSSTYDHSQCQPCPKMCDGQNVTGKCETDGDHRKCVNCSKGWYFNQTEKICSPCPCQNMSQELEEKCLKNGFNFKINCSKSDPTSTAVEREKDWSVGVICGVVLVVVFVACYCCSVVKKLRTFRQQKSHYPRCLREWVEVFCCCSFTCCQFSRDHSGENEMAVIVSGKKRRTDIAIGQLNAGTYDKVCRSLNRKLDRKDWRQLAGEMGYNNDNVKDFERDANPADVLLSDWKTKSGNNVMKLIKLLTEMGRDDIADLLESDES